MLLLLLASALAAEVSDTVVTLDPLLLTILGGVVIPLLTALLTKLQSTNTVKVLVSMVLSAILGVLVQINNDGGTFDWKQALVAAAVAFAAQLVAYQAFWRPVVEVNSKVAPNFGIGPAAPPANDPQI